MQWVFQFLAVRHVIEHIEKLTCLVQIMKRWITILQYNAQRFQLLNNLQSEW